MKSKLSGLDKTLIFIAILDTIFVIAMIVLYCLYQSVPDSLILSVFGATFGECGCCSYIWKHKKEKQIDEEKEINNGRINESDIRDSSGDYHVSYSPISQEQDC